MIQGGKSFGSAEILKGEGEGRENDKGSEVQIRK